MKIKKASVFGETNGLYKTLNFTESKFNSDSNFLTFRRQFSIAERTKRHAVFRGLSALVRGEHFNTKDKSLSDFAETVFYLPDISRSKNFGGLDDETLFKLGVCAVPHRVLNLSACYKLSKIFGDLSACGCFYKLGSTWLLDVDERLCKTGLLLPVRNSNRLIYGLKVYRYADDQRPFFLKLRADFREVINGNDA